MRTRSAWLAALAPSAVFAVVLVVAPLGYRGMLLVDDGVQLAAALVAAVSCARATARRDPVRHRAWAWLTASVGAWAAGQVVWSWYELVGGREAPFPSLADVGFLLLPLCAGAGLLSWLSVDRSRAHLVRDLLDGVLIAGSLFVVSWVSTLSAVHTAGAANPLSLALAMAYPIGDVVLATLVLLTVARAPRDERGTLWLLAAGLGALAVADSAYVYLTNTGSYRSGDVISAGWVAGFLLVAAAAASGRAGAAPGVRSPVPARQVGWLRLTLPYAPLLLAAAAVLDSAQRGQRVGAGLLAVLAGLLVVVLARQFLVLADNQSLVARLRAREDELAHQAFHDPLTGLANRSLLADRLQSTLSAADASGTATGLLLIDLDRFKEINDTLGHHIGDQLLVQVGARLCAAARSGDTVARLGGDEFAVLLPAAGTLADAVGIARALEQALSRPFLVDGLDLTVEASTGVVLAGLHGSQPAELLQRADVAMYAAKNRGLGVLAYDPEADSHSPQRLELLADLRRALSGDELQLHYQPTVAVSTGDVVGAEALLRWRHPRRGAVRPDEFIPLAENTGLIGPLTLRVLDLALAQARRWADAGTPLQVAVNLSARNLLDDRLDTVVAELLSRHGVPPALLKLEVTETAITTDPLRARAVLHRLHGLGVALAIDDFGAGYTSLGHLRDLPVTELKIDRSFVTTMERDPGNTMIVRSLVELGRNLELTTVAEGVENAAVLDLLARYGCDVAQGYHLSRPLPAEAFDEWRAGWARRAHRSDLVALNADG